MVNGQRPSCLSPFCAVIYGASAALSVSKETGLRSPSHILPAKSSQYLLSSKLPAAVIAVYSSGSDRDVV